MGGFERVAGSAVVHPATVNNVMHRYINTKSCIAPPLPPHTHTKGQILDLGYISAR
jgi:hypothetical protein